MADIKRPGNRYIAPNRKVHSLEKDSVLPILQIEPKDNQGKNGDLVIVMDSKGTPSLYFKAKNSWYVSATEGEKRKKRVMIPINPNNPTTAHFDTGWFGANDSGDTNVLSPRTGNYQIPHNLASDFVITNVYCRFECLRDGENKLYVIDLNSHISNSGPNASRYGYWIAMIDKNTIELNINPDGLSIIHGEILSDSSSNTSTLISSSDSTNVGSIEMRVFVSPVVDKSNKKVRMDTLKSDDMFKDSSRSRISTGNSTANNLGATVDGTKNSGFSIDSDGTGVLLKNNSGALKVRNLGDTADAGITAKKTILNTGTDQSELGTGDGEAGYVTTDKLYQINTKGLLVNAANISSSVAFLAVVPAANQDSYIQLFDSTTHKWGLGNDQDDSLEFKLLCGAWSTGDERLSLTTAGNLAVTGTVTSSAGECGGPAVTNHITNNASDTMTVSDFGANAALTIDADQPDTPGAENSSGLHID